MSKKIPQKVDKKDVSEIPTLKDYTKKKIKNDVDKITKSLVVLKENIEKNDEILKQSKERMETLTKEKEALVLLNNQF